MLDVPVSQAVRRRTVGAPYALPAGCAALLLTGAIAAATHGRVSAGWVLLLAALVVGGTALFAEPGVALFVTVAAWFTTAGFSAPPYAQLHVTWFSGARAALILTGASLAGLAIGAGMRWWSASYTLWYVDVPDAGQFGDEQAQAQAEAQAQAWLQAAGREPVTAPGQPEPAELPRRRGRGDQRRAGRGDLPRGIGGRRQLAGVLLVLLLPVLTAALLPASPSLSLPDDSLIFLVCVVGVAVVGGFWPAVLAAIAASLLLNWYFTPPIHTLTIASPKDVLELLLFVTVAVSVSSVVHLAARRALQAARAGEDAAALLALAQTVLGGDDTPAAILRHLTTTRGGQAELTELVAGQWVKVARAGGAPARGAEGLPEPTNVRVGAELKLTVSGQPEPIRPQLLNGFAAQAAAALDRDRLRTQAAQAEALAEGNRMRTALLAAVSHDLRTPLASIKASVSTVRQPGVELTDDDEQALLATIEHSADRLNGLIGNLLDMSRLAAGSLEPFLRPASVDEVAPLAHGEPDAPHVHLVVPDDLPLVRTDPGLLERVLANLFANAVAHSPAGRPPVMVAHQRGDTVILDVIDHGPGVADEHKDRIFEPFERLDERNTGTGVGLGLAVAHGFLIAMGGAVEARDTPGGGLTMRVTLPVARPQAGQMQAAGQ
jgi:two-component system sensor histidine kinase KdpD